MESRNVLFVDDDQMLLASVKRVLLKEPYSTLFATSAREAFEILKQNEVHVIITDMRMPQMGGLELLSIVKKEYPRVIRMVLSGLTQADSLLKAINQGEIFRYITKPWKSNEELRTIIRQAIEFYELHGEREVFMQFFEMWIEGMQPKSTDIKFLQELIATRKKHLYNIKGRS